MRHERQAGALERALTASVPRTLYFYRPQRDAKVVCTQLWNFRERDTRQNMIYA